MPRQRPFSKQNAIKLDLVHRAQNDPLIHDENAPSMVLVERGQSRRPTEDDYAYSAAGSVYSGASFKSYRSQKTKQRGELESEFGDNVRKNEGEAAQHGVFYDDTQYDYMQHMRDLGGMGSQWVEAKQPDDKKKGKQKLEDMLADSLHLDDASSVASSTTSSIARSLFPEEILPSEFVTKRTYQDQQDVPDDIAGFQPDMDPRLREVLEALEDEEYVDDDEDIFGELTRDGYEVERDEWEGAVEQSFDDDGWESDDTIKAPASPREMPRELRLPDGVELGDGEIALPPEDPQAQPTADPAAGGWDFMKEHKATKKVAKAEAPEPSFNNASLISSLASGRHKKRKGAMTNPSTYSMSSSALVRKDALRTLDERFDKMENDYSLAEFPEDEEDAYNADTQSMASGMSGMTGMSSASRVSKAYSTASGMSGVSGISSYSRANDEEAPKLVRSDFDGMMDDFLSSHNKAGKYGQRVRRGAPKNGMEQLDEIRSGLGPARFGSKTKPKSHVPVKIG
ncbi:Protein LTV1 [Cercospora beticola]|uniref:Protein LTV1 n=1 Tax=Cercospora beticola TaxID=122368 RepID=A0A2G5HH68_CERBT|nr:Protein LTV1 [Cercospora beticola]PIA91869.1 Protein LTV1 [Cercospora beticola]WPB05909.1 hypothetical protein RHO25_010563 [Cercospora beticola]CAK1365778.1 unnamed protein product [Cercospora beticola]